MLLLSFMLAAYIYLSIPALFTGMVFNWAYKKYQETVWKTVLCTTMTAVAILVGAYILLQLLSVKKFDWYGVLSLTGCTLTVIPIITLVKVSLIQSHEAKFSGFKNILYFVLVTPLIYGIILILVIMSDPGKYLCMGGGC